MQHHQTLPERLPCKRERKNKTDFLKGKELFSLSESYFLFLSNETILFSYLLYTTALFCHIFIAKVLSDWAIITFTVFK